MIYALHAITINHWHWYEAVYDGGTIIVGVMLGWCLRTLVTYRHIANGFRHLSDVSDQRGIQGPDIYTAFAWTARSERAGQMRRHRERRPNHSPASRTG